MTDTPNRPLVPIERFYFGDEGAPTPNCPIRPGVSAVIFDTEQRILFMKRTRSEHWSLPGGRVDPGESAHACCVRETLEETGLETRIIRLISVNTDPRSIVHYPDGNILQSFVLCFESEVIGGQLRAGAESDGFRWLRSDQLDTINLVPDSLINARDAWLGRVEAFIR